MNGFEDIKDVVQQTYPTPIAEVFRRCRTAEPSDLGGRHKGIIDLFEVFSKFLCIVLLQEGRKHLPNLVGVLPRQSRTLGFLKRPSLGGWIGLLRILTNLKAHPSGTRWWDSIGDWYHASKDGLAEGVLADLVALTGTQIQGKGRTPWAELCNAMVT